MSSSSQQEEEKKVVPILDLLPESKWVLGSRKVDANKNVVYFLSTPPTVIPLIKVEAKVQKIDFKYIMVTPEDVEGLEKLTLKLQEHFFQTMVQDALDDGKGPEWIDPSNTPKSVYGKAWWENKDLSEKWKKAYFQKAIPPPKEEYKDRPPAIFVNGPQSLSITDPDDKPVELNFQDRVVVGGTKVHMVVNQDPTKDFYIRVKYTFTSIIQVEKGKALEAPKVPTNILMAGTKRKFEEVEDDR